MLFIGENIHIISKTVREALENRDEKYLKKLIEIQKNTDCLDLNIGPAKGKLDKIFEWICSYTQDKKISFDSTNISAIEQGLRAVKNPSECFINSTSADNEKFERLSDLALEYNCNLIVLAMKKETGIPKYADARMELIFEIYEKSLEKGINPEKLYFDPLILPIKIDNTQAIEALNTIKMTKESFDPPVKTIIGLSNISNGAPKEIRPLINRVYFAMAIGAGLDAAIIDSLDFELKKIYSAIKNNNPQSEIENLYINLAKMAEDFSELNDIRFDKKDIEQENIIKAAAIILGKKIYSDSFTRI